VLAYTIIAIELAILYTVFWYVFLREPKPYRIRGNAWGAYDGPETSEPSNLLALFKATANNASKSAVHGDECGCQAEKDAKIRTASAIYEEWNTTSISANASMQSGSHSRVQVPLTAGELIRSQARGVERVTHDMPYPQSQQISSQQTAAPGAPHYAPFNPAEQYRSKYKKLPPFLAELGDKLNRINVKLP